MKNQNQREREKIKHFFSFRNLLNAYYKCRRHKRYTLNASKFEYSYEKDLLQLESELKSGTYQPSAYTCFAISDPKLREILYFLEVNTGIEFTITSLFRIGDTGVHGTMPLRAIDLRMRDAAVGSMVESLINSRRLYDPKRPEKKCCFLHGAGNNLHLHIQVHPNTVSVNY
jgi:hypothetical protein